MSFVVTKKALESSLKQLMEEKPFGRITVDDICERAEISSRNFYRYAHDKYDLLDQIYQDDFLSKLVVHDDWCVWDYFPKICRYCYQNRTFIRNALTVEGQNSPRSYWEQFLAPLILHDFQDSFNSEAAAAFYIPHLTNTLFDYMELWLKQEPCTPPDEFATYVRNSVALHAKRTWEITSRPEAAGARD